MRSYILYALFCFIISCKQDTAKGTELKKDNFKEHYIDIVKGTVLLPVKYEQVTTEKLTYLFSEKNYSSGEFELLKSVIEGLQADRVDFSVYMNDSDLGDVILFRGSDHINFSKKDANQYLGMLEAHLAQQWSHLTYERLQSKITRTERSKYIKIKHEISFPMKSIFQTQYIVTSAVSTFEMLEIRSQIIDYEDLMKRIHYKI